MIHLSTEYTNTLFIGQLLLLSNILNNDWFTKGNFKQYNRYMSISLHINYEHITYNIIIQNNLHKNKN